MKKKGPMGEFVKGSAPTLILGVLQRGPLHGYAISRTIEEISEGALHLGESVVYPTLRSLEEDGLVASAWEITEAGPARKVYTLTSEGRSALVERRSFIDIFTSVYKAVLGEQKNEATT